MTLSYAAARTRAVARALDADPQLMLLGGQLSSPFEPADDLAARYGDRIVWPPISEFAAMSLAVGAAMTGVRTLVPLSTSSFMFYGWPAVVLEAPNIRYLSDGATEAPVVFHVAAGARRGGGAQHEHTPQAMLQNIPGLRILAPGTPAEVDAAFHQALTGSDPTLIVDHVLLASVEGEVPELPSEVAPALVAQGGRLLVVASSVMVQRSLEAARELAGEGIDVAVLSVPCINPAPVDAVIEHAHDYEAVLFVDESRAAGSPASHLMARLWESGYPGRARLLASAPAPSPFATHLLDEIVVTGPQIENAVRAIARGPDKGVPT